MYEWIGRNDNTFSYTCGQRDPTNQKTLLKELVKFPIQQEIKKTQGGIQETAVSIEIDEVF